MNPTTLTTEANVVTIERVINAPKDKVWAAFAEPEIFKQWWGPEGWSTTLKHFDFAEGGYTLYGMKCEDKNQGDFYGQESWGKFAYGAITPKDSIAYTDYFCDDNGNTNEDLPAAETTITLDETNGMTKITSVTTYNTEAELQQVLQMGMEEGIKQTLNRLEKLFQ